VDAGFSGKDTDRPAFKRMIAYVKAGGVDAIAVTKLDRLTRSMRNLCEINEDILKGHGVHLICTRDGINTFELTSGLLMHLSTTLCRTPISLGAIMAPCLALVTPDILA
jgi:DNA invertase Pin-like site-specific DNA recombinase